MNTSSNSTKRPFSFWTASALVIGNIIGAGIYLIPASLAPFGGISLVGWLLTALGAIFVARVFASLSKAYPHAGGPYAYARVSFGDFTAFIVAWTYWVFTWVSNAAIAVAAISYLSVFIPILSKSPPLGCAAAIGLAWMATFINIWGIRQTALTQLFVTGLKIIPLVVVGFVGVFFINPEHFSPLNLSSQTTFGAIAAVVHITLWAFFGIESATIPAQAVNEPEKTIPRATLFGTVVCAVLYMAITAAVLGIVPNHLLIESSAPVAEAADLLFGGWARPLVAAGAVISASGCLVGWVLLQGQMPLAAALEGLFPPIFGRLSKRGIPVLGMMVSTTLLSIVLSMNYSDKLSSQFTTIVNVSTSAALIPYVISCLAYVKLTFVDNAPKNMRQALTLGLTAFGAIIYCTLALYGSGKEALILVLILTLAGLPIYCWQKKSLGRHEAA